MILAIESGSNLIIKSGSPLGIICGCQMWLDEGLGEPISVTLSTTEYIADMDSLGRFMFDVFEEAVGERLSTKEMQEAYSAWARENKEPELSSNILGRRLKEKGLTLKYGNDYRYYPNIKIKYSAREELRIYSKNYPEK